MSPFNKFFRLNNLAIETHKILFNRKSNWIQQHVCSYTRKSAEERLGIEKPKRPLTPFFKFMSQMRPAIIAKNPGITSKEAIEWSSKHWQQLDAETKAQMTKEYEKDLEDYKKIKELYEKSLTDEQKADIKRVKDELAEAKQKRKLKSEFKELGKPRKPMSSYFLFCQSLRDSFDAKQLKEFQEKAKSEWTKLPPSERVKYDKKAQDLMNKYKKDLEAWEIKMISMGRLDLVRAKPTKESKKKEKSQ
ncbi:hypothetical protein ACJJTC_002546 [Scirpophaga incertulas]